MRLIFKKWSIFCKWIDHTEIEKSNFVIQFSILDNFLLVCCVYTNSEESLLYYSFKQKCVIRFINTYYYLLLQKTKWCVYYKNTRILLVTLLSPILNLYNTCLKFLTWTSYNLSIIFLYEPYNVPTIFLHEPHNVLNFPSWTELCAFNFLSWTSLCAYNFSIMNLIVCL